MALFRQSYTAMIALSWLIFTLTAHAFSGTVATASVTSGTVSQPSAVTSRCNISDPNVNLYTTQGNETCVDISLAFNVSTPLLADINALGVSCQYLTTNKTLCLPGTCSIYLVQPNDTCTSILSNLARIVPLPVFRSWNSRVNSQCSNLDTLVGQYICLSPPGSLSVPTAFPLRPASSAVPIPSNAVTTSNADCGYWHTIQINETCDTVTEMFGISETDFYFLNPQLGNSCSSLWQGNSYCVQAVGNINTYSGYPTSSRTAYTTLASTINLNATVTTNRTTTWLLPTSPTFTTVTATYNSTAWEMTQNYTLCRQALAYYNISADDSLTSEMLTNDAFMEEYDRVCLLDLSKPLPTQAFNTSISLMTSMTEIGTHSSQTIATATARLTASVSSASVTNSASTTTTSSVTKSSEATSTASPSVDASPDGTCGESTGYSCTNSQFGNCCSKYGYCGSTSDYCETNCDPEYGECKPVSNASSLTPTSASAATPTSTANISPNGLCGPNNGGYTCLNSQFGDCCSLYGYCGSTSDYCASQSCDSSYGACSA